MDRTARLRVPAGAVALTIVSLAAAFLVPPPVVAAVPSLREIGTFPGGDYNGWILDNNATGEVWSSPAVGDVNGDGQPEIVVGGLDSQLRIYSTSAAPRLLGKIDTGNADKANRRGAVQASPALADMNSDGTLDIVATNTAGILATYTFTANQAGTLNRQYISPEFDGALIGNFATPALGYLDGDASYDAVISTWGQNIRAYSGPLLTEIPFWKQWLKDTVWSSPAIGDIDGDRQDEVVVGADCEGSGKPQPCYGTSGGGYVWAFNHDGSVKWSYFVSRAVIWSSPALADLNGDGAKDIVVGTGLYYNGNEARKTIALDGRTGRLMWEAPTAGATVGSPSVADVDGDGRPEVFIVSRGGRMYSYDGETGNQRYNTCVTDSGQCSGSEYATHGGAALADIDGDGQVEAITQAEQRLSAFDARTGSREATWRSSYNRTIFAGSSTPTVANVRGKPWIIVASRGDSNNNGRDDNDELVVQVWESSASYGAAPWPTFKQNMLRTSNADLPIAPNPVPNQNYVKQLYRDFLGREAASADVDYWTQKLMNRSVDRLGLATTVSRTDEWITGIITGFYRDTLGRDPDGSGLRGWIGAARDGMPVAQIAAAFYSSPEYFSRIGQNSNETWVRDLYRKLLLREPDEAGVDGWVRALDRGMPRDTVSYGFYQSSETLGVRITKLYNKLLARIPESGAVTNWSPFVTNQGDIVLAAALAASNEYFARAQAPQA